MRRRIKVGDRVSWDHHSKYARGGVQAMTGTVSTLQKVDERPCASVTSDGVGRWGGVWTVALAQLTKIEEAPATVVAATEGA